MNLTKPYIESTAIFSDTLLSDNYRKKFPLVLCKVRHSYVKPQRAKLAVQTTTPPNTKKCQVGKQCKRSSIEMKGSVNDDAWEMKEVTSYTKSVSSASPQV